MTVAEKFEACDKAKGEGNELYKVSNTWRVVSQSTYRFSRLTARKVRQSSKEIQEGIGLRR